MFTLFSLTLFSIAYISYRKKKKDKGDEYRFCDYITETDESFAIVIPLVFFVPFMLVAEFGRIGFVFVFLVVILLLYEILHELVK